MTKKDYEKAARLILDRYLVEIAEAEYSDTPGSCAAIAREARAARDHACSLFIEFFKGDNPHFDEERFRNACGVDDYGI